MCILKDNEDGYILFTHEHFTTRRKLPSHLVNKYL